MTCLKNATRLVAAASLLLLSGAVHGQWSYTTNSDNTIAITGYDCSEKDAVIPDTINGLPVTSIGFYAISCPNLTSITIPSTVTVLGPTDGAACPSWGCWVFDNCTDLAAVYFQGNAPYIVSRVSMCDAGSNCWFFCSCNATAYYLPGTAGWGPTFGGWGQEAVGWPTAPYTILQIGATDLGGGWLRSSWFGDFYTNSTAWIDQSELGWLYCVGTSTSNLWMKSDRLGWLWTTDSLYPFLWSDTLQAWLYYYKGASNSSGGWFYDYGTGQIEWK